MIHVTRLNNHPLVVNADLIKFVEITPDTVITLVTGEKLVILESMEQLLERIAEFRRNSLSCPGGLNGCDDQGRGSGNREWEKE